MGAADQRACISLCRLWVGMNSVRLTWSPEPGPRLQVWRLLHRIQAASSCNRDELRLACNWAVKHRRYRLSALWLHLQLPQLMPAPEHPAACKFWPRWQCVVVSCDLCPPFQDTYITTLSHPLPGGSGMYVMTVPKALSSLSISYLADFVRS